VTENYRADVDGLRAVAVLAVLAFHAGLMPRGYLGVDVFFVISGYLITQIIHRHIEQGRFSLLDFYARRVRRIVPLTLVVGLAALVVGCVVMLPDDLENLAQSVVATNLFSNNILQAITTRNYWDVVNEYKPLMHTWSLGVEEQFYILYPAMFLLLRRAAWRWLPWVLMALAAVSLAALLLPGWSEPDKFYHVPFRFWELAAGGLVAVRPAWLRPPTWATWPAGGLLLVLLVLPAGNLPPAAALVATVLATSVLVAGKGSGRLAVVLGCRPMAALGRISFGVYMWHQPLLAYTRYMVAPEPSAVMLLALLAATLALAVASHKLVEEPLRDRQRSSGRQLGVFVGVLLAATTLPALYIDRIGGVLRDVPELAIARSDRVLPHGGRPHALYNDRVHAFDRDFEPGPALRYYAGLFNAEIEAMLSSARAARNDGKRLDSTE
jgi:peptidoglycan/LPS O-acetylase OafA/YrhL